MNSPRIPWRVPPESVVSAAIGENEQNTPADGNDAGLEAQPGPRAQLNPSWVTMPVARASSRLLITRVG